MPGVASSGARRQEPRHPRPTASDGNGSHGLAAEFLVAAEDPEQLVPFLMRKFSVLIDRVQLAEDRQEKSQELTNSLSTRISSALERRRADDLRLQEEVSRSRSMAHSTASQLEEARAVVESASEDLRRERELATTLGQQCEVLSLRCQDEYRSSLNASDAMAHSDEAWAACESEKAQVQSQTHAIVEKLTDMEQETVELQERERHRRADMRTLEDQISEACRACKTAERRADVQHEEVCNALKKVTLYRERLDSARLALQRREEELNEEHEAIAGLRAESDRVEHEATELGHGVTRLREVKTSLEHALRQNVESNGGLKAMKQLCQSAREYSSQLDSSRRDVDHRLVASDDRLAGLEEELCHSRKRLQALHEMMQHGRRQREMLEAERNDLGITGATLQSELQRMFAETERLRSERDEATSASNELQRRLNGVCPAVETAKRRAHELELSTEDAVAKCTRSRNHKESLVREVAQCREKMRSLRKRHEHLAEKSQGLEKRLLRCTGSFGGTAGFAAAAASVAAVTPAFSSGASNRGALRTPRHGAGATLAAMQMPTPPALPNGSFSPRPPHGSSPPRLVHGPSLDSGQGDEASASQSLGYLKQWIELEEARLGTAHGVRTPPKPCPAPSSPAGRASPPPRSARALLALNAGVGTTEALAMLDTEGQSNPVGGTQPVREMRATPDSRGSGDDPLGVSIHEGDVPPL